MDLNLLSLPVLYILVLFKLLSYPCSSQHSLDFNQRTLHLNASPLMPEEDCTAFCGLK